MHALGKVYAWFLLLVTFGFPIDIVVAAVPAAVGTIATYPSLNIVCAPSKNGNTLHFRFASTLEIFKDCRERRPSARIMATTRHKQAIDGSR
mmetsp:Transcript_21108/g.43262  ORF Transcript_21108/g.43262 Transcript_21108/m.43262 type:complete len:92 (+) Transcript_21108:681-956(+)